MEGVKPLPGSVSQGNRDSFNSAYIFILNDRYPRAGKAGKSQRQRGLGRPGLTKHITVLRSSTFQRGFFLHGEGQSRFNRDDVPRSWERQTGREGREYGEKQRCCGDESRRGLHRREGKRTCQESECLSGLVDTTNT